MFVAPPECCPLPRWYSDKFSKFYEAFISTIPRLPSNIHLLPFFKCDPSMFELDGRHFKSAHGKDYLDHLFSSADDEMVRIKNQDDRLAGEVIWMTAVEDRVDLLCLDQAPSDQHLNVANNIHGT